VHAAALVKQVRSSDDTLVMDELSRLAVAQAVELCAAVGDGVCTALTVGDPGAVAILREAVAWGGTCNVTTAGMLLTDEVFADLDTLGTARTLAAVAELVGPFDLVLLGAASSDCDTGQLGPQLAELLDMAYADSARYLSMQGALLHVRSEVDGAFTQATVSLPAVVSCTAGLIDPCDAPHSARALVPSDRVQILTDLELLEPPSSRTRIRMAAPGSELANSPEEVPPACGEVGRPIVVLAEPDQLTATRVLLGWAADLAATLQGHVVVITTSPDGLRDAGAWGADTVIALAGALVAEDVAHAVAAWAGENDPWAILASSTAWGREATGRAAAALDAGLAGKVHALDMEDEHLVAQRRTDHGIVQITCTSTIGLATLTPDVATMPVPRPVVDPLVAHVAAISPRDRVRVVSRARSGGAPG
jgi:electron transfer flavoprotein alpha/beta subunit